VALLRRRAAAGAPEACALLLLLLQQLCDVPAAWVDGAAPLRRGQLLVVFLRHGPGAGIALMYRSLVRTTTTTTTRTGVLRMHTPNGVPTTTRTTRGGWGCA